MSSDSHEPIIQEPSKAGLRVIHGDKPEDVRGSARAPILHQLRTITIPPMLAWMAQRVSLNHGPWTTDAGRERLGAHAGIGRKVLWAALGALFVIVGVVIAVLVAQPDSTSPATPTGALAVPIAVASEEASSANVPPPGTQAGPPPEPDQASRRPKPAPVPLGKPPPAGRLALPRRASGMTHSAAEAPRPAPQVQDPERNF